eukprot:TRINITY_DN21112_c0_g1_i1.p1 TRINITY_DN21112_c0_g1~~TRINITY_DN21112_c0_g1_i1.p1  ORF type:complete len:108 (+),score=37.89 TRINITY_DN21112_c0_g1_i1:393-716(+)
MLEAPAKECSTTAPKTSIWDNKTWSVGDAHGIDPSQEYYFGKIVTKEKDGTVMEKRPCLAPECVERAVTIRSRSGKLKEHWECRHSPGAKAKLAEKLKKTAAKIPKR